MKHYLDINNLREFEEHIGDIVRPSNTTLFEVGDIINISEKYDGANASIENINGNIVCYSRNHELNGNNTLNGFWNYIFELTYNSNFSIPENYIIFGEWSGAKNKIVYDKKNCWLVFDIYDKVNDKFLSQDEVETFCIKHRLGYIHVLYEGPFISWEHCRSFMNSPFYGNRQEGIVIKNQTKLNIGKDFYLKIVNADFKERKAIKEVDPEKEKLKQDNYSLMATIVTKNAVEKMLYKLRDEGILNNTLTNKDMGIIAKNLPKRIFDDCVKEEPEIIIKVGEMAGKLCNQITMAIVKQIMGL